MKRALFLDRDGTIIADPGYIRDPSKVVFLPGAAKALAALASEGWKLIVISNQSGVGRGTIQPAEMDAVQARFIELMESEGAPVTASYICVHAPADQCECRKPSPFFLLRAAREHSIDLAASWMVGDREADILTGKNAGCSTIWLRNGEFPVDPALPDFVAAGWSEIRRKISAADTA
jgi:D-glycero-D-manno-heptose 1,7-bisphosphate phosphatase